MFSDQRKLVTIFSTIVLAASFFSTSAKAGCYGGNCVSHSPWRLSLSAGVMPTFYADKGPFYTFFPGGLVLSKTSASFKEQSNTPWTISLESAYAVSDEAEYFGELNYARGKGDSYTHTLLSVPAPLTVTHTYDNYEQIGFYMGARRFYPMSANPNIQPFLGAKLGLVYRKNIDIVQSFNLPVAPVVFPHYASDTTISGGIQGGVDFTTDYGFNWGAKVSVVASGARKSEAVASGPFLPSFFVGSTGTVVQIPLELYVRYVA